ncbi:MAG TPA: RING finger protein, partial [Candidatus Ozemobacteraceae bacterium]
ASPMADGDALPEVMKANKKVLGRSCAVCGKPIALGEQIHNCPSCHSVNHDACWSRSGGCTSPSCAAARGGHAAPGVPGIPPGSMAGGPAVPPPPGGTVPCRWCKEPIARGARKCKHCNEYQSDEDRATLGGVGKTAAGIDEVALSTTDWIGVVCCPIIALIQGLVYVAQGNPKGQRLILYSIISIGINGVIQALGGKH